MKTFENRETVSQQCRSHPWSTSTTDPHHAYHDFKARPELIPSVLEDLHPWDAYAAVRSIYDLLTWINGAESHLESNDCAFSGPEDNVDRRFPKRFQCCGRLGLLFRDLSRNTNERAMSRWVEGIHVALGVLEPDLAFGAVGTTRLRVDYRDLPEGRSEGSQILVSFWAWGDDDEEVFDNLARVIAALREALESSAD